jgi:IclR family acetate operon transcriptional repressor
MQGVERVLNVLEAVAYHQPIGVGDLAKIVELPKSTVQRHLWALAEAGWIRPVGEEFTRWTLTSRALLVGQRGSSAGQLREVALEPMRGLRDATEETVTLQVPVSARDMVQIERVDSQQPVRTFVPLGQVTPMYATSGGLAYLAHLPADEIDAALEGPLPALTDRTVTEPEQVRSNLEKIRRRGYAINVGMNRDGVCAVGTAICDSDGRPVAGIGLSIPESRFSSEQVPNWAEHVLRAVALIESRI